MRFEKKKNPKLQRLGAANGRHDVHRTVPGASALPQRLLLKGPDDATSATERVAELHELPSEIIHEIFTHVITEDLESTVVLLSVRKAWRRGVRDALRAVGEPLIRAGLPACAICMEELTNAHEPLASPCNHLVCTPCFSHCPMHKAGDAPSGRKVLRCACCRHEHDSMRKCVWVEAGSGVRIFTAGRRFNAVESKCAASSKSQVLQLDAAEAARLDAVALTLLRSRVQRSTHEATWWDRVGSQLVVIENANKPPARLRPGDRLTVARIGTLGQCNLWHVDDDLLVQLMRENSRVFDVVFRRLQKLASAGRLRYCVI